MKLSVNLALATLVACSPSAPAKDAFMVDDAQAGQSLNHFAYTGKWEHLVARSDGRFDGTSSRSYRTGDSVVFPFEGSVVRLYGVRGPNGGEGAIAIDGHYYGTADFFSEKKQPHAVVFQSQPLAQGNHALGIIVEGDSRGSHRAYVNLDGAEVLPGQSGGH